jgi:hypothetical protein
LAFTADNFGDQFVSDIDINSIYIYNRDPNSYKNFNNDVKNDQLNVKNLKAQDLFQKYHNNKIMDPQGLSSEF